MEEPIGKAIQVLNQGGIIIFSTDTAFGIGCRMDDEKAVKRLFEIRKRPESQAVPVLVDSIDMAREYVLTSRGGISIPPLRWMSDIDNDVERLMKKYWPGGLTIVLKAKISKVPILVRGGGDTIGARMPDHEIILEIIKQAGVPILGPSANFHGEQTPFNYSDLNKELVGKVDYILKGECTIKKPSTVIDCTVSPWKIVREGAIKINF